MLLLALSQLTISSAEPWSHSWDTVGGMYWADFGYSLLTEAQAKFAAENFFLASLEKCTGKGSGVTTEQGIYQTAAQIKKYNPKAKTTFYWHTGQAGINCYANNDVFMAHKEWWLKDDNGNYVGHKDSAHAGNPQIDPTIPAAVDWWVSVPLAGDPTGALIDGVLADGSAFSKIANISATRLNTIYEAKLVMIGKLQAAFDATGNGGIVFGNGMNQYDQSPVDPHGLQILDHVNGIQNEHYAAFEQVHANGTLDLDKVANTLLNIETASAAANASKQVFCSFWAGPYHGVMTYFDHTEPCGANDTKWGGPNCTAAQKNEGWKSELVKWLPFNLASFLSVAGPNTWFTQAVWYADNQGFFPCPDAPGTCMVDSSFYSDYLARPLGAPLGPRNVDASNKFKWTREFAHATVTLDLTEPLSSGVAFH